MPSRPALDRAGKHTIAATYAEKGESMAARFPAVVFAPNGGATFVVRFELGRETGPLPTPMPAIGADGRLAAPWRWGGHHVDLAAHVVHFAFVNRLNAERWTAEVPFE